MEEEFYPESLEEWRSWLVENHMTRKAVWIIFNKKSSGLRTLTYEEAVEEALCFGWIDTQVKSIDSKCYKQRFTPRKSNSRWSELNIKRVEKLIGEKRMGPAGFEAWSKFLSKPELGYSSAPREPLPVPEILQKELMKEDRALAFFTSLSTSSKNTFIRWMMDAKMEETRERRAKKIAERCLLKRKPGIT